MTAIGISELLLVTIDGFYNPQGAKLLITYLKQTDATQLRIRLLKNGTTVFEKTVDVSAQSKGSTATYPVDLSATDLSNISSNFPLTNIDSYIDMDRPWKSAVAGLSPGGSLDIENDSGGDRIVQAYAGITFFDIPTSGTIDLAVVDPDGNEYNLASKQAKDQFLVQFDIFGLLPNGWRIRLKNNSDKNGTAEMYAHDNTPGAWNSDSGVLAVEELDSGGNVIDQGQATVTVKVANMQKKVLEAEAILLAGMRTYKIQF
ncbi:MAG TPA: hypothetical protein EYP08_01690 [Pyrodictiaceae archaeon]|nr:hypothetical protein [Pyrodictiaceae archaeon]